MPDGRSKKPLADRPLIRPVLRHDPKALVDLAFEPVAAAIEEQRIPGGVVGVVTAAGERAVKAGGSAQLVPTPEPMRPDTVFDLASLTKVLLTVPTMLRLVEAGRLDLDDPLWKHLPELGAERPDDPVANLTIRRLLIHQSGLPPTAPLHRWSDDPIALRDMVLSREWTLGEPAYSDINYILAGLVLEAAMDTAFDALPTPPGLTFAPSPAACAATEDCAWRGRILRGEVHDEAAAALGGAGHAGLFGSVDAVLDFALAVMDDTLLSPAAIDAMRRPQTPTRALGWEIAHPGWSGGSLCSDSAIGHLGFTGVGLWIDAERRLAWALLTNRVHPSRHVETGIMDLRRAVSNRVQSGWAG